MNKIDRIIELLESIDQKLGSTKIKRVTKKKEVTEEKDGFWEEYKNAFFSRYKVLPERNAMINGMINGIRKRVSTNEIGDLVKFFISQNDAWYLREMHHIRCLVKDCEMLLTRMKSKVVITSGKAREMERTSDNINESQRFLESKYGKK